MSNITLKVEFLAGTPFRKSVCEAKELAISSNVGYVSYDFNGIKVSIGQGASVEMAVQDFEDKKMIIVHS